MVGRLVSREEQLIRSLALDQLGHWALRPIERDQLIQDVRTASRSAANVALFAVNEQTVNIVPKPGFSADDGLQSNEEFPRRARRYLDLLTAAVRRYGLKLHCVLALALSDECYDLDSSPIFAFQKPAGSKVVLLPDIDIIRPGFSDEPGAHDPYAFIDKAESACFCGATTGGLITEEVVATRSLPRLRAAEFFLDRHDVIFRLPNIAQCATAKAEAMLREMGYGDGATLSWSSMFRHRYLISMDGNGATCSRLAFALRSNSVVLKYHSVHQLFYFSRLQPWVHYVPIAEDADVLRAIMLGRKAPEIMRQIARHGSDFFDGYLSRARLEYYVAELLKAYAERIQPAMTHETSLGW